MEPIRQLSGVVVERQPTALKVWVQTPGGEFKNFQTWLSSAETQQPVHQMWELDSAFYSVFYIKASKRPWTFPN